MIILGVNDGWHDSSAALVEDGRLVRLIETDRVSRVKNGMHRPVSQAIAAVLDECGLTVDDIDLVAFGWEHTLLGQLQGWQWSAQESFEKAMPLSQFPRKRMPEVVHVPHHRAHAASAMYLSGLERSGVLVVDGRGECQSTSIFVGTRDGLELVREWPISESLGNFYGNAADWVGFSFWGPGKLMGLAPYGTAGVNDIVTVGPDGYSFVGGRFVDDIPKQEQGHLALVKAWYATQYPYAKGNPGDIMAHAGMAATVQGAFEEAMFRLAEMATEAAGTDTLVIAGGAGQNCTFNGRIHASRKYADVFLPPVTHDTGVSVGAALYMDRERRPGSAVQPRLAHAYYGHTPSPDSLERAAALSGYPHRTMADEDLMPYVASRIAEGAIVGWFQGPAEIGQRALGARSMLCDPRDRANLARVNEVKGREVWRPLAPSVLEEYASEFFEGPLPHIAQFMLAAMPVKREAWHRIPATVHVDGSARPQFVRKETNPRYWNLIDEFRRLTGVPVVMNTSFNLAAEPIVHTADDAMRSFAGSGMDMLVLGNHLIEKPIR